jgi:hypothetical protein
VSSPSRAAVLPPPTFSADWGTRGVGEEEADWGGGKEAAIGEGAEAAIGEGAEAAG